MTQYMNKGKRIVAFFLVLAMMMVNVPAPVFAVGTTNEDGYIEIDSIEDLYLINQDLTANYILTTDIDMTEATAVGGDWDYGGRGWNPIGSGDVYGNTNAFSGTFDGNGHKIIGMRIDVQSLPAGCGKTINLGLFGNVSGTVKNLVLEGGSINFNVDNVTVRTGSVCATLSGSIYNCKNYMDISVTPFYASSYTGGIVGYSSLAQISNSSNHGNINFTYDRSGNDGNRNRISGILGYSSEATSINNCYNSANITGKGNRYGNFDVSGIADGLNSNAITAENCYNSGTITATNGSTTTACGIGYTVTAKQCYNIGDIVEGDVQYAISAMQSKNCYFLSGTSNSNSGSTALTNGQMKMSMVYEGFDFDDIWALNADAVYPYPQLQSNIYDLRVIKEIGINSLPAKTEYSFGEDLDLTASTIYVKLEDGQTQYFDITSTMVSGYNAEKAGVQTISVEYYGFTTTFDIRVNEKIFIPVYTIEDLYNIRDDLSANYILMNDIDLTNATAEGGDWDFNGNGWNPIGSEDVYSNSPFTGEFNGNGHKIIGMRIEATNTPSGIGTSAYYGLFAEIHGKVYDLVFEGGSVEASIIITSAYAGALAGYANGGTITNTHNRMGRISETGNASYSSTSGSFGGIVGAAYESCLENCSNNANIFTYFKDAGGIAGRLSQNSIVACCYNTGTIEKGAYNANITNYTGGITGTISSSGVEISNCYNSGTIKSAGKSGGIAGVANSAIISNCYNSGTINSDSGYGIAVLSGSTIVNAYYLNESGRNSTGSTSLTETQMKIQSMYKGFDFENTWMLNEYANHPYPQLRDNIQDIRESAKLVSIIAIPAKTDYLTGDKLDFTGAIVKVVYVSGREEIIKITDDIVSGFDMNVAGEQVVTVTVAGASDTYTINVIERPVVESITITSQPNTKIFAVGTAFDFTGAKALVSYVGGITETVDITPDMTTGGDINHIGKQTITYAFGGKSATFVVEVVGVALEKIVLTKLPDKLNYLEGQDLDLTGMVVTAVMNNGIENTLGTGYTVSGYSSKPGTYTVTVTYLEKVATFEVTVAERKLISLALNALPDKLEYVSGQEFDESGMQVIATYDNGDVIVAEQYTVSGFDSVPGIKNIVVSLDGQSVSFTVKVIARVITDFKLVTLPSKLDYIEYDSLDISGLKVEATYNDGVTETVTDYALTGFSSKPGTHTINVAYEGFVKSFEINVIPRVLEDIKVIAPNKVMYYIGEAFDATGIEVIACYNNGQEIAVDDYTVSGFESAAPGAKTISITYGGITRSFAIAVQERSVIEANGSFIVDNLVGRLGEEVRLPVTVTSNTGIAGLRHEISFEASNLKFVGVEMKGDYANGTLIVNEEKATDGKITIVWFSNDDVENKGIVYELVFQIQETAVDGITEVKLDFAENDHGNISGENVIFGDQDGSVEVRSYWLGDLNGDRKYAMVDLVMLAQYVADFDMTLSDKQQLSADVNEDGTIDIHDVILLNQWLLAEDF